MGKVVLGENIDTLRRTHHANFSEHRLIERRWEREEIQQGVLCVRGTSVDNLKVEKIEQNNHSSNVESQTINLTVNINLSVHSADESIGEIIKSKIESALSGITKAVSR